MNQQPTAPTCIVEGCEQLSALSAQAEDQFFRFTTFYCANCYEKLVNGEDVRIQMDRIVSERRQPGDGHSQPQSQA